MADYCGPPARRKERVIITWRWVETITQQLELCGVRPDETAAVVATDTDDAELRGLVALALERLGCRVHELIVRSGSLVMGEDPIDDGAVAAALLHSDLVVDVNGSLVEQSSALDELLDEARVLALHARSLADLDHLVAHPGLLRRVERALSMLDTASRLSVTSDAGTQLDVDLTDATVSGSAGQATITGELAHWPAGAVWIEPAVREVTGTLIAMPGDLVPEAGRIIRSPLRIELEKGHVADILGDTGDGDLVRSYLESFDDETVYDVSGLGWGLNITRGLAGLALFDEARLAVGRGPLTAGAVNVRTGRRGAGLTLSLCNTTVLVDDTPVVDVGRLQGALTPDMYERAAGN